MIEYHAKKTNDQIARSRKISKTLFEVVREIYLKIEDCPESVRYFKLQIDADRSTINKMIQVASDEFIMSNLDDLPTSWGTLYAITNLMKKNRSVIESAFADGKIHKQTTLKEIYDLVRDPDPAKKSAEPLIKFDSSNYEEDQIERLNELLSALETEFGFKIQDTAKQSETPFFDQEVAA